MCGVPFLEVPPGVFGCSARGTADGRDGTSDNRWGSRTWSGVGSTTLTMVSLNGMGMRSLGNGRIFMDACKMVEIPGVVVASTTEGSVKVNAFINQENEMVEDGGGRFYSVRMQCTLRVCFTV